MTEAQLSCTAFKVEYMENISKLLLAFHLGDFRDVQDLLRKAGVNL